MRTPDVSGNETFTSFSPSAERLRLSVGELFLAFAAMAAERVPPGSSQQWNARREFVRRLIDSVDGSSVSSAAGVASLTAQNTSTAALRTRLSTVAVSPEFS